mmetsp:Transcript_81393/g.263604  ORF Transcript_81393/g.263604 Transcript_81393/m.263604 type:complete len:343 (-) Transcript_81393:393-1421(-)
MLPATARKPLGHGHGRVVQAPLDRALEGREELPPGALVLRRDQRDIFGRWCDLLLEACRGSHGLHLVPPDCAATAHTRLLRLHITAKHRHGPAPSAVHGQLPTADREGERGHVVPTHVRRLWQVAAGGVWAAHHLCPHQAAVGTLAQVPNAGVALVLQGQATHGDEHRPQLPPQASQVPDGVDPRVLRQQVVIEAIPLGDPPRRINDDFLHEGLELEDGIRPVTRGKLAELVVEILNCHPEHVHLVLHSPQDPPLVVVDGEVLQEVVAVDREVQRPVDPLAEPQDLVDELVARCVELRVEHQVEVELLPEMLRALLFAPRPLHLVHVRHADRQVLVEVNEVV